MLINHSEKTLDQITDVEGRPLMGERMVFERIVSDCTRSHLCWHMFFNLWLDIPIDDKPRIEIDFLLACCKGIVVIEVKGGKIEKRGDRYINFAKGKSREIFNPFHQAEQYKWALFNNKIFLESEIVIASACAFPAASFPTEGRPPRLWAKEEHTSTASIADFCLEVIESEKKFVPYELPDLSDEDFEKLLNRRLTASILTSAYYSSGDVEEALDWLRIDDENAVKSLISNNRLFFEGGPGTGKTTIAKTYVKHFPAQHGLYLCWNVMLAAKFSHKIQKEHIGNCDVSTYGAFVLGCVHSGLTLEDLRHAGTDVGIRERLREGLRRAKDDPKFNPYDYIILDEAHDYLDKGVDILLDELASFRGEGLKMGRFLVFYDREQGFANQQRELDLHARSVFLTAARFSLLDCRRVPTNKDIVLYSRKILHIVSLSDLRTLLEEIEKTPGLPISVSRFRSSKELLSEIGLRSQKVQSDGGGNESVLLTHSNIKRESVFGGMSLTDAVRSFAGPIPLTKNNVNEDFSHRWPTASILEYKGLECMDVTVAFSLDEFYDTYELYIGLSRAIQSVSLLILDQNA